MRGEDVYEHQAQLPLYEATLRLPSRMCQSSDTDALPLLCRLLWEIIQRVALLLRLPERFRQRRQFRRGLLQR